MSWDNLHRELREFAAIVGRVAATANLGEALQGQDGQFRNEWESKRKIRATDLPLPIPRNQALHPTGCELERAFLSFQFERDESTDFLPSRAEYQVRVEATLYSDSAAFALQDHWRIDTDMYAPNTNVDSETPDPAPAPPREPHPLFHFQRGGHAQDAFSNLENFVPGRASQISGAQWKGLMQTPGPRIPALPLDPLLAIDFCIGQNDGPVWRQLRRIPEYSNAIRRSQNRLWTPFFAALNALDFRGRWLGNAVLL